MTEVPDRVVSHDFDDDEDYTLFQTGTLSTSLFPRSVTKAEKDRWRKEDLERDKRRIKPGFALPQEDA